MFLRNIESETPRPHTLGPRGQPSCKFSLPPQNSQKVSTCKSNCDAVTDIYHLVLDTSLHEYKLTSALNSCEFKWMHVH